MEEEKEEATKGDLFGPEAIIMLGLAVFFDLVEILINITSILLGVIPYIGLIFTGTTHVLSILLDVIALLGFSAWILLRSGPKKGKKKIGEIAKKRWVKPALMISDVILPFVPFWTVTVFLVLKNR